ncbi:molybdopterin molybdotransferase MoeA [soil metagenome]
MTSDIIETWSVDQAQAVAVSLRLGAILVPKTVALVEAVGCALAVAVTAPIDIPACDNAAMDGIAWAYADGVPSAGLHVIGSIVAGDSIGTLNPGRGECVRIMTGATLPDRCDTVAPIESCRIDGDQVHPTSAIAAGSHVRRRGEDIECGSLALDRGRCIGAGEIALLAALGIDRVSVQSPLRVAVLSTGKELARAGSAQLGASVFDSNAPMMMALLQRLGLQAVDAGVVDDDASDLVAAVAAAARHADVVITTGGTGAGDADHSSALAGLGWLRSGHVAIKPGRPLALGEVHRDDANATRVPLFCLPGNPVAALISYLMFVRPRLLAWQGFDARPVDRFDLATTAAIDKRRGRVEVVRARYSRTAAGLQIAPSMQQGSGMLRSLGDADALIVLDESRGPVSSGETVEVWPLAGLLS